MLFFFQLEAGVAGVQGVLARRGIGVNRRDRTGTGRDQLPYEQAQVMAWTWGATCHRLGTWKPDAVYINYETTSCHLIAYDSKDVIK